MLLEKRWWLNPTGFVVRYVIYFALWLLIAGLLNKWSREEDATGNPALADRMSALERARSRDLVRLCLRAPPWIG